MIKFSALFNKKIGRSVIKGTAYSIFFIMENLIFALPVFQSIELFENRRVLFDNRMIKNMEYLTLNMI